MSNEIQYYLLLPFRQIYQSRLLENFIWCGFSLSKSSKQLVKDFSDLLTRNIYAAILFLFLCKITHEYTFAQ